MGVGVGIDALLGVARGERNQGAGPCLVDEGGGEVGCALRRGSELRAEGTPGAESGARGDEAGAGGVPEGGGAAVAEHDLVAVGHAQEGAQALLQVGDDATHGGRAVGGAHEEGSKEGFELVGAHLGGAAAEASVGGQESRVNVGEIHHDNSLTPRWPAFPSRPLIELS